MTIMDIRIRKAVPGEEKQVVSVNVRTWKTAYRGIVDQSFLDALSEDGEKRLSSTRCRIEDGSVYVAEHGGGIVGIAIFGPARDEKYAGCGELYALYVLKKYERSGIGQRLLFAVKSELAGRGYKKMIIACFTENPSCRFYEKVGGTKTDEGVVAIGGRNYRDSIFSYIIASRPSHTLP